MTNDQYSCGVILPSRLHQGPSQCGRTHLTFTYYKHAPIPERVIKVVLFG